MAEWDKYLDESAPSLLASWEEFCKRIGASVNPSEVYNILHVAYSEQHRAYHTLNHIDKVLDELEEVENALRKYKSLPSRLHLNEIEMALWFHDVVYDIKRRDNEERSARLAFEYSLQMGMPDSFAVKSKELVLVTKHREMPQDDDSKIVADIDLSILGKPEEEYQEYENNIRLEYWKVPEGKYMHERAEILINFLSRPSIYSTKFFMARYEKQARKNLERTVARFGRGYNKFI